MLTDEKFCDAAMKFVLVKDTDNKYYTLDEYLTLVEAAQTDKDQNIIYLYATDPVAQYTYINAAMDKGYNVLLMDGQLDSHFIGMLEQKLQKTQFVRVDSDVIDNLIRKSDRREADITPLQRNIMTTLFQSQLPKDDKVNFLVSFESLSPTDMPILITQNEYMRRMKDMAALQPGMSFYGELPDSYNLTVNTTHPLVERIRDKATLALSDKVSPIADKIDADNAKINAIHDATNGNKPTDEQSEELKSLEGSVAASREEQNKIISDYASQQSDVNQLIDLALLGNGLLRGEHLNKFIRRSVELM